MATPDDSEPCGSRTLAQHAGVRVDACACGQVHVTIGSLTIRLDRARYLALCDTLLAATRRLPERDAPGVH
jgi:hypothetical protein